MAIMKYCKIYYQIFYDFSSVQILLYIKILFPKYVVTM